MHEIAVVAAFLATLGAMYRVLFSNLDDLIEHVKFWLSPDAISLIRGDHIDEWWSQMKIWVWVGSATAVGYGVHQMWIE